MDCVFMVKLFHHMVVNSDKISGRNLNDLDATSVFWQLWGNALSSQSD